MIYNFIFKLFSNQIITVYDIDFNYQVLFLFSNIKTAQNTKRLDIFLS